MLQTKHQGEDTAQEPVLHDKPIALRMTKSEREEAFALAAEDERSASNFALRMYRIGLADYKAKREALRGAADS
ncbi:hypothetical protein B2J88_11880 [Rhodococcus sp. SRB_17]|uniref:hypothetical protein n=1 Tax=Acidovorax sp. SRB_24 TaxID=1962700 RepID=UPI00145D8A74|nr:hypothetical protein [Acidovorax sp. SRB_24]NMM75540.1 hypothetical protein [Acidovorax sp. SRB_24]NMM85059.1 hypothetical protein [Rhodococcus sp. SRB_17]